MLFCLPPFTCAAGEGGQVPAVPSLISFCCSASALLRGLSLLPTVAVLLLPVTKLLAEVGRKQGFWEGITHWGYGGLRSREQPAAATSAARGGGLCGGLSPRGNPPTAPQASSRHGGSVWGSGPEAHGSSPAAALWLAGWQLSLFLLTDKKSTGAGGALLLPRVSSRRLLFPFLALLACLLINKPSSGRERRLGLRAALLRFQLNQDHRSARPGPSPPPRLGQQRLRPHFTAPPLHMLTANNLPKKLITASAVGGKAARDISVR